MKRLPPHCIYDFKECLGEGELGKVFRAVYRPSGQEVAIKVNTFGA